MAMGAADLIPGVSGGTIALITGIYEELIDSIKSIDGKSIEMLIKFRLRSFWMHINGSFLLNVFAGILVSLFSLARLLSFLLENYPIPVWSFFFGLIFISAFYVFPQERKLLNFWFMVFGLVSAFIITTLSPTETPDALWFIFLSGSIAICAMILPGISGSFILLLLAKYDYVLEALKAFDLKVIVVFSLGCLVGLLSFSHFISWLLRNHRSVTLAILAGFMLGSLNKVWPWKDLSGDTITNLLPGSFVEKTGEPSHLILAIFFFLLGVGLVMGLEKLGKKLS